MQRLGRRRGVEHGRNHEPQDPRADHRASVGRAGECAGIGSGRKRQHRDRTVDRRRAARGLGDCPHLVRNLRTVVGGKGVDVGNVPEQRRGVLERVLFGELDAIHAAIDRTKLGDGRDRRIHHRQIRIETAKTLRLWRRHAALLQAADVLGPIAMAARIRRRLRADQSPADIGVEGRRGDREFGSSLPGREVERVQIFHID
jgi:hypothetical protein